MSFFNLTGRYLAFLLLLTGIAGCAEKPLIKDTRLLMGTFVEVFCQEPRAGKIVFDEITRLERMLSKYDKQSEIYRLNQQGAIRASEETFQILLRSVEFSKASSGALDITVGPLVRLWGFEDKNFRVPSPEEIKTALPSVGYDKIVFNIRNNVVQFKVKGMQVDLGAVGKGYAVDAACAKLKQAGIKNCLINAGGQIHCLGFAPGNKPWRVAIKNPRGAGTLKIIELSDKAIATSGDYEQYFLDQKKNLRYAHIINPQSGYPEQSGVITASVIADNGMTADALATAMLVLGRKKGLELVAKFPGAKAVIIEEQPIINTPKDENTR